MPLDGPTTVPRLRLARRRVLRGLILAGAVSFWPARVATPQTQTDLFESRIRPILENNCFACHTGSRLGGLALDSRENMLKGGKSGPAVVPGKPNESLLLRAVSQTDERLRMPPQGKLTEQEISDLRHWIETGAPWSNSSKSSGQPSTGSAYSLTSEQKQFWAFQPLKKPRPPEVKNKSWARSPIDLFVMAKLEASGLSPVGAATKEVLLRRATFDLIGLPPTPEEVDDFLRDTSPDAFSKVVDRLLSRPQYGERWGRYWLDVARFAEEDTHGWTKPFPNAFRYRDWVIQALNSDMPYDLFVKAQIAGDLLKEGDREKLLPGLGFFGIGPRFQQVIGPTKGLAEECNDRVDTLSRGFLGLTVACARCHDHKFDPISVRDYYALAGVFASSDYHEYPLASPDVVKEYQELERKIADQEGAIKEFIQSQGSQLAAILATRTARYLEAAWRVLRQPGVTAQSVAVEAQSDQETLERWVKYLGRPQKDHPFLKAWDALLVTEPTPSEVQKVAAEFQALVLSILKEKRTIDEKNRILQAQAEEDKFCKGCNFSLLSLERNKFILWRDLFDEKRPTSDDGGDEGGVLLFEGEKIGRFLGAEWRVHLESMQQDLAQLKKTLPPHYPYLHGLAEAEKPANLRVHLRGDPENLGEEVPRHFLAVLSEHEPRPFQSGSGRLELAQAIAGHPLTARVIANRIWSLHFGRGIVSTPNNFGRLGERPSHPELLEYLASRLVEMGWSIKALHREILQSATYQLSSAHSPKNFGVDPDNRLLWRANRRRLDAEALRDSILYVSGRLELTVGGPSSELSKETKRRTIYAKISRHKPDVFLALFDFPHPAITSEQRNVTNVPLQQLFFLNSELITQEAEQLAKRLEAGAPDSTSKIRRVYRLLFGRNPAEKEILIGLDFLKGGSNEGQNWQSYVQMLLSSNEFSFVD